MSIKARFFVREITKFGNTDNVLIKLSATIKGSEDNKDWAKYTPSGNIEMSVTNPPAIAWFEDRLGKDVSLTFGDIDSGV